MGTLIAMFRPGRSMFGFYQVIDAPRSATCACSRDRLSPPRKSAVRRASWRIGPVELDPGELGKAREGWSKNERVEREALAAGERCFEGAVLSGLITRSVVIAMPSVHLCLSECRDQDIPPRVLNAIVNKTAIS
ncbi:MAG: hypothetical protein HC923_03470 [Myxococcales bacterium]|nr:hypothetical protein [Myxococcales bacterium]